MKDEILLQFKDGYLTDIWSDEGQISGCETCDYGSEYINDISFVLSNRVMQVYVKNMYEYAITTGWLMTTILPEIELLKTFTEDEFIEWLSQKFYGVVRKFDINDKENYHEYGTKIIVMDRKK